MRWANRTAVIVRAVQTIRVLRQQRPTLAELADKLGTTERTARRYIASLEEAHVPVRRYGPRYRIEANL